MFNKIKKILNNKGMSTIETGIICIVIITVIGGMVDLNGIIKKFNATSSTTSYIARTISTQGGARMNKPASFSGEYVTSQELYSNIKSSLNSSGIEDDEFNVYINNRLLKSNSNLPIVNHGNDMTVRLEIEYEWDFINQILRDRTFEKISSRNVVSSYKNRTSSNAETTIE